MRLHVLPIRLGLAVVLRPSGVHPAAAPCATQHPRIADGAVRADRLDAPMVTVWRVASGSTTPWWITAKGTGRSTLLCAARRLLTGAIIATHLSSWTGQTS